MTQTDAFRVVVVADLVSSDQSGSGITLASAKDFAELIRRHAPRLRFDVPNLIGAGSAPLSVDIAASSLKELTPRSLVDRLAPLTRCREVIESLAGISKGRGAAGAIARVAATCADLPGLTQLLGTGPPVRPDSGAPDSALERADAETAAAQRDDSVDRIMSMVDAPDVDQRAAAAVSALLGEPRGPRPATAAQPPQPRDCQQQVQDLLNRQLDSILHHPQFRRAEATWRGLKLLVDRTRFRNGVRLTVHHAERARLVDVMTKRIVEPAEHGSTPAPQLWVAPTCFEGTEADVALVSTMAHLSERIRSPLLLSAASGFQGTSTSWQALRTLPPARWLAVATNPLLARAPYSGERRGVRYEEAVEELGQLPWADPVWAMASSVIRSYQTSGWSTEILGHEGRIEDLPVVEHSASTGRGMVSLRNDLSEKQAHDLAEAGLVALCSQRNSDSAFLWRTPMVCNAERDITGGDTPVRGSAFALPQRLLMSQIARAVDRFRRAHVYQGSQELQGALESFLSDFISSSGPSSWVDVKVGDTTEGLAVSVALKMGRGVLGGTRVELDFTFPG